MGCIEHAKEALRRDLRPNTKGKRPRDYEESDAPEIAKSVRELKLVGTLDAQSASFAAFRDKILSAAF